MGFHVRSEKKKKTYVYIFQYKILVNIKYMLQISKILKI